MEAVLNYPINDGDDPTGDLPHPPCYRVGLWLSAWRRKWGRSDSQTCSRIDNWNSISHAGGHWGRVLNLHVHVLVVRIRPIWIKGER